MGMPEMARSWTREQVLALPDDGNRYELFGGELLVTPAPNPVHQALVGRFFALVEGYVRVQALGLAFMSPADVSLDGEQLAQPDLFVVPSRGPVPRSWADVSRPTLVIEVLSPSTARYDRQVKRRWFQRTGIEEYWIVDPDARQVQRWRPDDMRPEVLDESIEWHPSPANEPLRIDLVAMFIEVLGPA
jgi:Uma2 family endonuclease